MRDISDDKFMDIVNNAINWTEIVLKCGYTHIKHQKGTDQPMNNY